jgi:hypothetical protein
MTAVVAASPAAIVRTAVSEYERLRTRTRKM